MTSTPSPYNLSGFTSQQLDILAQQIEEQKPFSNYFYRIIRFFAHNLLAIWVLSVLPYLGLSLYTNSAIFLIALILSNMIARNHPLEKMTIRHMLQRYADIGVEDRDISKKKRRRYYLSMFNWACMLYLPFIAVLWMERDGMLAVEQSIWIQVVIAWGWIAAFMAYSHTHFKWRSLEWDLKYVSLKMKNDVIKGKNSLLFGLFLFALGSILFPLFFKSIIEEYGLFGTEIDAFPYRSRKWLLYKISVFIAPSFLMGGFLYFYLSNKITLIALFLKKQLDKNSH